MNRATLGRVLIVDDEVELMQVLSETLSAQGYDAVGVSSASEALAALRSGSFDLVLTDLMMPGTDGLEILRASQSIDPDIVVIVMTGQGTIQSAVESLKSGAFDYLLKPFKLHSLLPILSRGLELRHLRAENLRLRESSVVHEFARSLAGSLDARSILGQLAQGVLRHLPVDGIAVLLPSSVRKRLEVVLANGPAAEALLRRQVDAEPLRLAFAARNGEPVEGYATLGIPELAQFPCPHGEVAELFPLQAGGKFVGVLILLRNPQRPPWAEGTRTAIRILASTAATALENATLIDEVRRAERRYRGIFEQSSEGIFQVRPDGRFLTANPALARMLGYASPESLLAAPADQSLTHKPGWQRFLAQPHFPDHFEAELECVDGSTLWVAGTLRPAQGPEGPFLEGRLDDVTERKRLETIFLRTQRMEVIGSLAGGIAHDLNNVLAGILMGIDNLRLDLSSQEREAVLQELRDAAQRGASVVRQVLAFARGGEEGGGSLRPTPLLRDLGKLLRHLLPRGVTLRIEAPDDLWPIPGDGTQFYQVLMNLCVNSRDAMPQGGTLKVTASNSQIGSELPILHPLAHAGPHVRISVEDTGTGIPPDRLGHIFEPFFTTKPPGQGTGLGLSTVRDIVQRHGGFVAVASEEGVGTRFDIYWPTTKGSEWQPKPRPEVPAGNGELILVVEAERSAAELARAALEAYGYRALVAHEANSARDLLARHGEDLRGILLDNRLGEPCAEALNAWRDDHAEGIILRVGGAGSDLAKPYSAELLLRVLHAALHPRGSPRAPSSGGGS